MERGEILTKNNLKVLQEYFQTKGQNLRDLTKEDIPIGIDSPIEKCLYVLGLEGIVEEIKKQNIDVDKPKEVLKFISDSNCDVHVYFVVEGNVRVEHYNDDDSSIQNLHEISIAFDSEHYYPIANCEMIIDCDDLNDKDEIQKLLRQYDPTTINDLRTFFEKDRSPRNFTLLYYASKGGNISLVESLFELFPHIKPTGPQGPGKNTPLHVAFWRGHTAVAKFLLRHGADPEEMNASKEKATSVPSQMNKNIVRKLDVILKRHIFSKSAKGQIQGFPPEGEIQRVQPGEDKLKELSDLLYPMNLSSEDVIKAKHLIAELLRMEPPTPLHQLIQTNKSKASAFYLACRTGNIQIVEFMYNKCKDKGATLEMSGPQDKYKNTPLHVAHFRGHIEVVRFLLKNGVEREKNIKGEVPGQGGEKYSSTGTKEEVWKAAVLQDILVDPSIEYLRHLPEIEKIKDDELAKFRYLDHVFQYQKFCSLSMKSIVSGVSHSEFCFHTLELSSFLDLLFKRWYFKSNKNQELKFSETFTYEGIPYTFYLRNGEYYLKTSEFIPLKISKNVTPYSIELNGKVVTIPHEIITNLRKKDKENEITFKEKKSKITVNLKLEQYNSITATCAGKNIKVYADDAFEKLSRISLREIPKDGSRHSLENISDSDLEVQNIEKLFNFFFEKTPGIEPIKIENSCVERFNQNTKKVEGKYSDWIFHGCTKYLWSLELPVSKSTNYCFSPDARYFMKSNKALKTLYLSKVIVGVPFQTTTKFNGALPPLPKFNNKEDFTFDSYLQYDGKYWFYYLTEFERILPCYKITMK